MSSSLEKQIGKFLARVSENLPEMSVDIRQGWIDNPKGLQNLLLGLCPPSKAPAQVQLLRKIVTMAVTGVKKFIVKDHIKEANVGWTGENFEKLFLGNVENDISDITVAIYRLETASLDAPILTELGDFAEIKLAHFFKLLKKQSKGEDGILLTNGYTNVAYVIGNDGNFWAVDARWDSDSSNGGWGVEAYSVENPYRWNARDQILSRDS